MDVHDEEPQDIYADLVCDNCDTPAARKISGAAGHSADFHPCLYCDTVLVDVNKPCAYDSTGMLLQFFSMTLDAKRTTYPPAPAYTLKDDRHLLRQAYLSRDATTQRQSAILKNHGIRWSTLNIVADWLPSQKTALDFMHDIFLGLIVYLFTQILFAAHMFTGASVT